MIEFERKITVGNVLTVAAVLISAVTLLVSLSKDRQLRERDQANRVRTAAGETLAGFERWQSVSLWLFQDLQPLFVETSEKLKEEFDLEAARDFVWKGVNNSRTRSLRYQLDEKLEKAYVNLYSYHPDLRELVQITVKQLQAQGDQVFVEFISELEFAIVNFKKQRSGYQTAELGNLLRTLTSRYQMCLEPLNKDFFQPLEDLLTDLVLMSDTEILRKHGLPLKEALDRAKANTGVKKWRCRESLSVGKR